MGNFCVRVEKCIADNVPPKTYRDRSTHEPAWFNGRARKVIDKQRRLYNTYKKTGCSVAFEKYKDLRRQGKYLFRRLEKEYMKKQIFDPSKPFYR